MTTSMNTTQATAFVVILNADNTEGRGPLYPGPVCEIRETAERLAKGKGVQGTDADVRECTILVGDRGTLGPVRLEKPSSADLVKRVQRQADETLERKRKLILEKAQQLGLSDEEIALLKD